MEKTDQSMMIKIVKGIGILQVVLWPTTLAMSYFDSVNMHEKLDNLNANYRQI